tara:strand:- start:281 stop:697 length:417 start_codon:yes stop_codon:yes gene_type:complete
MDVLQATILKYRLNNLHEVIKRRRTNAEVYFERLKDTAIQLPIEGKHEFNTYHTFVVQTKFRDALKEYLEKDGINTAIHYPTPIHLQPAAKFLNYKEGDFPAAEEESKKILTLPIHQFLKKNEIWKITDKITDFLMKT